MTHPPGPPLLLVREPGNRQELSSSLPYLYWEIPAPGNPPNSTLAENAPKFPGARIHRRQNSPAPKLPGARISRRQDSRCRNIQFWKFRQCTQVRHPGIEDPCIFPTSKISSGSSAKSIHGENRAEVCRRQNSPAPILPGAEIPRRQKLPAPKPSVARVPRAGIPRRRIARRQNPPI